MAWSLEIDNNGHVLLKTPESDTELSHQDLTRLSQLCTHIMVWRNEMGLASRVGEK